ncbi:MAG: NAD(P)H-dependent oxidoreductase [Brevundimonas sp.]|uniref:NAD(P)H-dependent oxidoreductase n=1 Tax=Brevundimonas sp. TaxID=1871086 RepID=UPI002488A261|nr:NAD(P)H-dependent oxidoreductase [Brevundimonas sp.]MDI1326158.1 NAD(P)H-dependent oxidoreductase [Brevundimonas sp.]
MSRRILILDGHPDPDPARYCHALAASYAQGAVGVGHVVHRTNLSDLDFPVLRSRSDWEDGPTPAAILALQDQLDWAEHVVIIYPLWLGDMPARLKALLEQAFRPAFAFGGKTVSPGGGKLKGRSARIVVTMGMPAAAYRIFYLAHSLRSLKRNVLALVGIGPIRDTIIGGVETRSDASRKRYLAQLRTMGARAD